MSDEFLMATTPRSNKKKASGHAGQEVFRIVGTTDGGRTIDEIAIELECLVHDLRRDAGDGRSCASDADTIMHLCADIIALSNQSKKEPSA